MNTLDYLLNYSANRDATITCRDLHSPISVEIAKHTTGDVLETRSFQGYGEALKFADWRIRQ